MLGRLLREPLLHFLLLGGVLFVIFGRGGPEPPAGGTEIVVTTTDIQRIAAGFSATWQRPPSENELQGAINDYIREEALSDRAFSRSRQGRHDRPSSHPPEDGFLLGGPGQGA